MRAQSMAFSTLAWAQYGIDLPGLLHKGTFNSSNTDVVKKVNLLVAASQHGGGGYFGGGRIPIARGQKLLCFGHFSRGDPFLLIFSKTKF